MFALDPLLILQPFEDNAKMEVSVTLNKENHKKNVKHRLENIKACCI